MKAFLAARRAALPHSRILFVRRPDRRGADGLVALVARSRESGGELRRLELDGYGDLLGLDLDSAGTPVDDPLFLVCTHGKHDRCCSRFGRPLYDAVRDQVDDGCVWQCTHVGGDRFAGNLVSLPDGVYYGRVEPGEAWPVVEAVLGGRVHLPLYRGRSCHSFPAQAAERAVRELTGLLDVGAVGVSSIARVDGGWGVVVRAAGAEYDVAVRRDEGQPTHLTCSTEQLRRPTHYVAGSPRARAS